MNIRSDPHNETVVFISGASNGIVLVAAERFAKEGYTVIETALLPEKRPNLLALEKRYPIYLLRNKMCLIVKRISMR